MGEFCYVGKKTINIEKGETDIAGEKFRLRQRVYYY